MQQVERQRAQHLLMEALRESMATGPGAKKPRSKSKMQWAHHYFLRTFLKGLRCASSLGLRIVAIGSFVMTVITTLL
eukprot:8504931-Lingulodinium_polyedra.AAC.1